MTELQQMSFFTPRNVTELVEDIKTLNKEIQELYCLDEIPWVIGYSGGKDSTTVLQLIWNAIADIPLKERKKKIHVITTDTLVENPFVSTWVRKSINRMKSAAQEKNIPIEPHLLHPTVKDTFWVNLMGKGYPAPRNGFRWCTDRMKIEPVNQFIRDIVRVNGETIVVLGTRKAESSRRAATMKKHEVGRLRDRLSPNARLPNSLIYTPIEDWRNDEVWLYLNQWPNPWGHSNKDLFSMYRGATADNECPLVVDTSTPSCGDSRFGCWVCTMVSQDKSMEAMIQNDVEKQWMQPLLDLRNELDAKNDRERRDFRRIYGRVELFERNSEGKLSIEPIPGPYTKESREYWLRRLLQAQKQIQETAPPEMRDITLITQEELSEIRRIWLEEKHEFDDSLPGIYQEVTGQPFQDTRTGAGNPLLGTDEWAVLTEICHDDPMHLELMTRLLDTERQYFTKPKPTGIYSDLEKCFDTSSRNEDQAIDNAHYQYNLKTTIKEITDNPEKLEKFREVMNTPEGESKKQTLQLQKLKETDTKEDKQLSWADLKFGQAETTEEED
ncbi:DNA phosphorothioation system sulfurtransferase DndC [Ancylothrix sp. C2]|uniref:DNA phosphorothioation system sulfurtransferase DndC n=1 Tax=Ancylothrix sp. D3o TaxID=2953691 RepID=UPI0021BB56CF|nr:DNA phosphorothioation system sulfurtransferase DndC [Ancylothrix sp. D3o]MCT7949351.1 DNA phosphorothioation system sulfurtransferase DndC [Ancylothrix sp. D3o]